MSVSAIGNQICDYIKPVCRIVGGTVTAINTISDAILTVRDSIKNLRMRWNAGVAPLTKDLLLISLIFFTTLGCAGYVIAVHNAFICALYRLRQRNQEIPPIITPEISPEITPVVEPAHPEVMPPLFAVQDPQLVATLRGELDTLKTRLQQAEWERNQEQLRRERIEATLETTRGERDQELERTRSDLQTAFKDFIQQLQGKISALETENRTLKEEAQTATSAIEELPRGHLTIGLSREYSAWIDWIKQHQPNELNSDPIIKIYQDQKEQVHQAFDHIATIYPQLATLITEILKISDDLESTREIFDHFNQEIRV